MLLLHPVLNQSFVFVEYFSHFQDVLSESLGVSSADTAFLLHSKSRDPILVINFIIYDDHSMLYLSLHKSTEILIPVLKLLCLQNIEGVFSILQKVLLIFPQYALGDGLVKLSYNQFMSEIFERFGLDNYKNPFTFEMIAWHMVALAVEGTVFFILALIADTRGCVSSRYVTQDPVR